jgi:hypothetical protein
MNELLKSGTLSRRIEANMKKLHFLFLLAGGLMILGCKPPFGEKELTVTASPSDGGSVTRSPLQAHYAYGSIVFLTANPANGYVFDRWEGDTSGWGNPQQIAMDGDKTVTAVFTPSFQYAPHPLHTGTPTGSPPIPGGETVICTELHRQGLMDETIFKADDAFGRYLRKNQKEVLIGYHCWAKPVVSFMQKSHIFTQIVNVLAKPWTIEMAYRIGPRDKGSFAGTILMDVGVPICRMIGRAVIWAGYMGIQQEG